MAHDCMSCRERLSAYLDDALPEEDADRVRDPLVHCDVCRRVADELEQPFPMRLLVKLFGSSTEVRIGFLVAVAIGWLVYRFVVRRGLFAETIDTWRLRLPVYRAIHGQYLLSWFSSLVSVLIGGGVPVGKALGLAAAASENGVFGRLALDLKREVEPGGSVRDGEIDAIAQDLLRDVPDPTRPAVHAVALRAARAIRRGMELDRALDQTPGSRSAWDVFDRVVRLREAEDRVVQRGLLALDLLRERQVEVRAELARPKKAKTAHAQVH